MSDTFTLVDPVIFTAKYAELAKKKTKSFVLFAGFAVQTCIPLQKPVQYFQ
jgi:hypothetical protein